MTRLDDTTDVIATDLPPGIVCGRCDKRPATRWWAESVLAFARGMRQAWCARCCCEEQLRFARERAATIPELEKQLAAMDAREADYDRG